jgi:antitoxin CcdA
MCIEANMNNVSLSRAVPDDGDRRPSGRVVRKATNVSLPVDLLDRAKKAGVNVSRASERGLLEEVRAVEAARWAEENDAAIKAYNAMVERDGLPLEDLRMF